MPVVANLVSFKVGWLACVLGGANGLPWLGALIALVIVTAHVLRAPLPATELKLIIAAGLLDTTEHRANFKVPDLAAIDAVRKMPGHVGSWH